MNGQKTTYLLQGDTMIQERRANGDVIGYAHDATGKPVGFEYYDNAAGTMTYCYYRHNLQGDITDLCDRRGNSLVHYTYDAWGKLISITGEKASTLGVINPLRYRGYYYDSETGLYYLQSRYYDPEVGRFISADGEISGVGGEILGYNMFAYCMNNPVNMDDAVGGWPKWLTGALNIAGGIAQMAAGAALGATLGWTGFGAVVAGFLVVNGAAQTSQGIGQVVNHVTKSNVLNEENIPRKYFKKAGRAVGGKTGEAIAGGLYDTATVAANMYAGGAIKNPPCACFVAGTTILTSLGKKAIEDIETGDLVWAKNVYTNEITQKKVVQTFVRESKELVYVRVNGEEIITTPEHPFYVPKQGWTGAIHLRAGDILVLQSGKYAIVEKTQHEILELPITVYNFEVEDFHTCYVGKIGILVHNACKKFTPDQQAVIVLARGSRNGLSRGEAETLVGWAKEYGLPGNPRIDMGHVGRGIVSRGPHAHVGPVNHIPIFE